MSLFFPTASGSSVNCGRISAADNLTIGTIAGWIRVLTWAPSGDYFGVVTKSKSNYSTYTALDVMPALPGPIGGIDAEIARATTWWQVRSGEALVFLNVWCFVAMTWDFSLTANDQYVYGGTLNSAVNEPGSYSVRQLGVGTISDNSAESVGIGNFAAPTAGEYYDGGSDREIHFAGMWPRQLSRFELDQVRLETAAGLVRPRGAVLYTYLGRDIGIQPDLSGNGLHGTLATTSTAAFVGSNFPTRTLNAPAFLAGATAGGGGGGPVAKTDGMFFATA